MIGFVEFREAKLFDSSGSDPYTMTVNPLSVSVITRGKISNTTHLHMVSGAQITVEEPYDTVKQQIVNALDVRPAQDGV